MKNKVDKMSVRQLESLLKSVVEIAESAGIKLEKRRRKLDSLTISSKEAQGVVSEADVEAEKFIIKKLKPLLDTATFLAEESAFLEFGGKPEAYKHFLDHEYAWIIDPLDGTTNFLNNLDYYGVCICLVRK
jgi:myo-inositol-1(or 4)-monophosphatase